MGCYRVTAYHEGTWRFGIYKFVNYTKTTCYYSGYAKWCVENGVCRDSELEFGSWSISVDCDDINSTAKIIALVDATGMFSHYVADLCNTAEIGQQQYRKWENEPFWTKTYDDDGHGHAVDFTTEHWVHAPEVPCGTF